MSKRHRRRTTPPTSSTKQSASSSPVPDSRLPTSDLPFRPWLLATLTALFVARPLVPSEGVAWLGDGQPFCMLWLLLALGTSLAAIKAGGFPRRFGWMELLVALFAILHSFAAWQGAILDSPRPTINMLWEGASLAISFLLVRQLVKTACEARALVAVMVALAVVLSAYGLYQVYVGLPADRAEYARDADGMLRRAGQWYAKGSPERMAFEDRLNSTEPLATFALTNSLAGYLATWLVVAFGLALTQHRKPLTTQVPMMTFLVIIAGCLVLTKSRSAAAACLLGTALILVSLFRGQAAKWWKSALAGLVVIVALVGIAFASGGLDAKVFTEAGKSFEYRLQYWRSTTAMIRDWPLFGVGPGNFQDFYTQYKLPEASEEIRDPHNWVFEIAATAGLPALAAFCGAIAFAFFKVLRAKPQAVDDNVLTPSNDGYVYSGAAFGFVAALIIGPLAGLPLGFEKLTGGLLVGGATLFLLHSWVRNGTLPPSLLVIGAAVMLVNLLAAGGIMYPAVAGSLWLLVGLGLNLTEPRQALPSKLISFVAFVSSASLVVSQYLTGYSPVLRCQGAMMEAQNATDILAQEHMFAVAAEVDPFAAEPWQELAALKLRLWLNQPSHRVFQQFQEASTQFLRLKPHASSAYRLVGNWFREVFEKRNSPEYANAAARYLKQAVDLYPSHATLRAELSMSLADAGQGEAAKQEAAKALELDAATLHTDKKLPAEIRQKITDIAAGVLPGSR